MSVRYPRQWISRYDKPKNGTKAPDPPGSTVVFSLMKTARLNRTPAWNIRRPPSLRRAIPRAKRMLAMQRKRKVVVARSPKFEA